MTVRMQESSENISSSHGTARAFENTQLPPAEPETVLTDEQKSAMFGEHSNKPTTPKLRPKSVNANVCFLNAFTYELFQ